MVGRSDIEEIEIDDGNISFDADDSASNLSEPRQLRRRKSKQDSSKDTTDKMEKLKISATTSRQLGIIQKKKLMDKEREEFLNEFDQTTSERERRKKDTKEKIRESTRGMKSYTSFSTNLPTRCLNNKSKISRSHISGLCA